MAEWDNTMVRVLYSSIHQPHKPPDSPPPPPQCTFLSMYFIKVHAETMQETRIFLDGQTDRPTQMYACMAKEKGKTSWGREMQWGGQKTIDSGLDLTDLGCMIH